MKSRRMFLSLWYSFLVLSCILWSSHSQIDVHLSAVVRGHHRKMVAQAVDDPRPLRHLQVECSLGLIIAAFNSSKSEFLVEISRIIVVSITRVRYQKIQPSENGIFTHLKIEVTTWQDSIFVKQLLVSAASSWGEQVATFYYLQPSSIHVTDPTQLYGADSLKTSSFWSSPSRDDHFPISTILIIIVASVAVVMIVCYGIAAFCCFMKKYGEGRRRGRKEDDYRVTNGWSPDGGEGNDFYDSNYSRNYPDASNPLRMESRHVPQPFWSHQQISQEGRRGGETEDRTPVHPRVASWWDHKTPSASSLVPHPTFQQPSMMMMDDRNFSSSKAREGIVSFRPTGLPSAVVPQQQQSEYREELPGLHPYSRSFSTSSSFHRSSSASMMEGRELQSVSSYTSLPLSGTLAKNHASFGKQPVFQL